MVKLIYNGVMAKGRYKSQHFEGIVNKGEKYDIPTEAVDEFIKSGDWKKPEAREKPIKKVKEVFQDDKVDSDSKKDKSNYGGNKKW